MKRITTIILILMFILPILNINIVYAANDGTSLATVAEKEVGSAGSKGNAGTKYQNWANNQGSWCAMFVAWCANQAGISSSIIPQSGNASKKCTEMYNAITNNGGIVVTTPQRGDLVFFKYSNSNAFPHVGIMVSATEMVDGGVYPLVNGKVGTVKEVLKRSPSKYSNALPTTPVYVRPNYNGTSIPTTPPPSSTITVTTTGVQSITQTNAYLVGSISGNAAGDTTSCGFYFGKTQSEMQQVASFPAAKKSINYSMGCDMNKETAYPSLTPNTTYYYRAYAVGKDGKIYTGDVKSFKTMGDSDITITTNQPQNITQTSATLNFSVTSKNEVSSYSDALYIGTSMNNLQLYSTAVGNPYGTLKSTRSINIEVNNLQSSTTYYYYYSISDGKNTYESEVKSFKTIGTTPPSTSLVRIEGALAYVTVTSNTSIEIINTATGAGWIDIFSKSTGTICDWAVYNSDNSLNYTVSNYNVTNDTFLTLGNGGSRAVVTVKSGVDIEFYLGAEYINNASIKIKETDAKALHYISVTKGNTIEIVNTSTGAGWIDIFSQSTGTVCDWVVYNSDNSLNYAVSDYNVTNGTFLTLGNGGSRAVITVKSGEVINFYYASEFIDKLKIK